MFVAAFFVKTKKALTITTAINVALALSCIIGYKDTMEDFFTAMSFLSWEFPTRCLDTYLEKPRMAFLVRSGTTLLHWLLGAM